MDWNVKTLRKHISLVTDTNNEGHLSLCQILVNDIQVYYEEVKRFISMPKGELVKETGCKLLEFPFPIFCREENTSVHFPSADHLQTSYAKLCLSVY